MKVALKAVGWTLFAVVAFLLFIAALPFLFWWGVWVGLRS